ncbi:MAG: hypothetical protein GXO87_10380 [Chlorobi bacterium]|nr:hypothetical protein [Chlorobiota bacterium]
MKNKIIIASLFFFVSFIVNGQKNREFFTLVKGDSVAIFLINPPGSNEMFDVFKKGKGENYKLLTVKSSVRPVRNPKEAMTILGADWELFTKALDTDNEFEILRNIRSGGLRGGLLSLISLKAAKIAGRIFIDESAVEGEKLTYKVQKFIGSENRQHYEESINKGDYSRGSRRFNFNRRETPDFT